MTRNVPALNLVDDKRLIGVVHLAPTPGSPGFKGDCEALLAAAEQDARALAAGGVAALIVENFGDVPFFKGRVPAETVATLALALERVRSVAPGLAVGINVLRNDARSALGLCAATGASFLRVNVLSGAAVTDQGVIEGCAAELMRERARLAPHVQVLADVHVKHATPLGRESLVEAALDLHLRAGADALIVSGAATGSAPRPAELEQVRAAIAAGQLLVGSGLNLENAAELMKHADGAIVGTALKIGGRVGEPVDEQRVRALVAACGRPSL